MSFPAWSSFATGLAPGRHGIFDFTQKQDGAYRIRFVNAADRAGEPFWMRASRAGRRVLCLGVPATFPPDRVDGLLVPGFDAPVSTGSDAAAASDPALYTRVAARAGRGWCPTSTKPRAPTAGTNAPSRRYWRASSARPPSRSKRCANCARRVAIPS